MDVGSVGGGGGVRRRLCVGVWSVDVKSKQIHPSSIQSAATVPPIQRRHGNT